MLVSLYLFALFKPKHLLQYCFSDYKKYIKVSNKFFYTFLFFFKKHSLFVYKGLRDILVVDSFLKHYRFVFICWLVSYVYNSCLTLYTYCGSDFSFLSITNLFKCADWIEREIWDMFGIFFNEHLDLRRILNDYGFRGFPLLKDFPLSGFIEIAYDDDQESLQYNWVVLSQEYRHLFSPLSDLLHWDSCIFYNHKDYMVHVWHKKKSKICDVVIFDYFIYRNINNAMYLEILRLFYDSTTKPEDQLTSWLLKECSH